MFTLPRSTFEYSQTMVKTEIDALVYDELEAHYKEQFKFSAPYSNAPEKWSLIGTCISLLSLLVTVILRRFQESQVLDAITIVVLLLFMLLYTVYLISYLRTELKSKSSPTSAYMTPMRQKINREYEIIGRLEKFDLTSLNRVRRRLLFEKTTQGAWLSLQLGAAADLGLVPAAFSIYALHTEMLARALPHNIDVVVLAIVVGYSLGAAMSKAVMLKINSMIFVLEEAIESCSIAEN